MTDKIQLITVENTLSKKKPASRQQLEFLIRVANLGYDKQVDVVWSGADGIWHATAATFMATRGDGQEYWQARITLHGKAAKPLADTIRFALRYRCQGNEYWDNNAGHNYTSHAGSGLQLTEGIAVQNLGFSNRLNDQQQWLAVNVAVNPSLKADKVTVYWTIDNWRHTHQSSCRHHKSLTPSGTQLWTTRLRVSNAFRVQYAVYAENLKQKIWDNNAGANYVASRKPLNVLVLNLHCYQEDQQDRKFSQIAKAIDELAADIVCFQEVAEHWNHGHGNWASNSANIINQRLKRPYHLYYDWSHLGFDKYREGVAILSRHSLHHKQSRYVSDSHDAHSIHSRKVLMARIEVPYMGWLNVFSAHLSWLEDGFQQQFQRLCDWADQQIDDNVTTNLLCGDFNITAGSAGYRLVVDNHQYEDQYLAANAGGLFEKIFRVNDPHWHDYPTDDYRIDYIFMNKHGSLRVTSARVLFTEHDYGRVSDHCGYLMTFEPK